jgi:hypothetical protein
MMRDAPTGPEDRKAALKQLREARRDTIAAATRRVKEQKKAIKAIKARLSQGGLTVPEIAAATGLPTSEVMWYVASLKKYGGILEGPKDGSYFRYQLADTASEEVEPASPES